MPTNPLFLLFIFIASTFAHTAGAEENLNLDSHLPYIPNPVALNTQIAPSLTVDTKLSTPASTTRPDSNFNSGLNAFADPSADINLTSSSNANPTTASRPAYTSNNLWQRIRDGFAMRKLDSPLIARHEKWYSDRPEYMARMLERSQRYLFYITEEVERRGMPSEIALLPMIESAFNPGAYSVGKASGIWQFIPSTGKNFGMQQNWWCDERRDIISATTGALDYLQKLHDQFDDWELALAAYNWGEGAVARAQAKNRRLGKPVNFSSLRLPPETQNYVPKLLAIKSIISDPERFGLKLNDIPNQPYFAAIATSRPMDVKLAAQLAEISLEEFIALNPSHNRPVILQGESDDSNILLLPIDKLETFQNNLEKTDQRLVSWRPYQTKKGEHFDQLAPRFGLSANQLRSVNGLSVRAKISTGQTLLVPSGENATGDGEFEAFNTHLVSIDPTMGTRLVKHTVRKGDTVASIARRYHVSVARLKEWNVGLNKLKIGQGVTIVQAAPRAHKSRLAKARKSGNVKLAHTKPQKHLAAKAKPRVKVALRR